MKTDLFDFELPPDRIATHPVSPRDASRLLAIGPDGLNDRMVRELPNLLRPGDLMVFNDTRVIPAKLMGRRGEAKVEIMLHKHLGGRQWRVFAKPAKRLKVGDIVIFNNKFSCEVKVRHDDGQVDLEWNSDNWLDYVIHNGQMPLPPYMKRQEEASDKNSYQTIYAQKDGAVAAPTAGLHFTEELLQALDNKGIERTYVTLHVGAGTFQPVKVDDTDQHIMHTEYIEISNKISDVINVTRKEKRRIIAVGTTSLRVLESAADENGVVRSMSGETGIFITPGYKFKVVDGLMTNFHLPRSTLFMLVSAFMGLGRMQQAYQHAIDQNYRFYSYGDACLLLP